ncbi:hypothetical protein [Weissella confusa]|uniref:hypothetical protein n=1 Tax=Weissella confusa TaxID=1583 RepID=UPI001FD8C8D0|nr:hypothetical protein [Weissella confusa]MED4273359.1 hypothetical protein [Weissella confusa]
MALNMAVSDKREYRKTLKGKIDRRGTQTMGIILLYVVTSIFDMFVQPNSQFWMTLSLAVLTTAILFSVSRVVYTLFLRGIAKGLLGNLPLIFLIVAWVFKAVALSYTIR